MADLWTVLGALLPAVVAFAALAALGRRSGPVGAPGLTVAGAPAGPPASSSTTGGPATSPPLAASPPPAAPGPPEPGAAQGPRWPGAVALGLGAISGLVALLGWPRAFPPTSLDPWLPWLVLLAAALAAAEGALPDRAAARAALRAPAALAVAFVLLRPRFEALGLPTALASVGLATGAALALAAHLDALLARRGSAWGAALLALLGAGVAGALVAAGSASQGQLAGTVASAAGGLLAAAALLGRDPRGAAPVVAAALVAVGLRGHVYAELTGASAALLLLAPCGAWLAGPARARLGRAGEVAGLLAVAALLAAAVGLSFRAVEQGPYGGYGAY